VREHYIVDRDQMAKDSTDFSRVKMMGDLRNSIEMPQEMVLRIQA